jgi:uncharacterized protein (DUF849 family)
MSLPTIIAVAPNGARKTKLDHPSIPLTVKEIGETAKACMEAGASMIHLHVRNEQQKHSLSVDLYKEAIKQVRMQTGNSMLIQVTSESVGSYMPDEQFSMIHRLKPPAVSIGLREIKGEKEAKLNQHFKKMRDNKVQPQLILYNDHDVSVYKDWLQRGVLPGSAYPVLYVVGKPQKEGVFESEDLKINLTSDQHFKSLMTCGFGYQELHVAKKTLKLGGHIRIGFENNELLENKIIASSNAELITQVATFMKDENHTIANVSEAQELMKPDW